MSTEPYHLFMIWDKKYSRYVGAGLRGPVKGWATVGHARNAIAQKAGSWWNREKAKEFAANYEIHTCTVNVVEREQYVLKGDK